MTPLQDIPIRRKLMLILLFTSSAVALLTCGAFFAYDALTIRKTVLRQLATQAEIIADNSTAALAFDNPDDAREILRALRAEPHIVAAALYDPSGKVFARYPADLPVSDLPSNPAVEDPRFAHTHLSLSRPVILGDRRLGTLFLRSDLEAIAARLRLYGLIALAVIASALFVAFILARVLQRQISGPVLALAGTARAVSEQRDYSVRAQRHGADEIGQLTDAFNQMLGEIEARHRENQDLNHSLEQRVQQRTAQLEAANKELEAFSYSVSHDLRAPLRHIDGYAQLLHKRVGEQVDETGRRFMNTISQSAQSLGRLIDELLEFSRMGRTELRHSTVDSQALVAEARHELEAEAQGRRIEWRIDPLPVVQADPAMMRQVWRNLLGNAVKYSRQRDPAVITVTHAHDAAGAHVFTVRDNGAGFDMKYAAKLFGVFQRLHGNTEFEGTGIGLANVRRIILRHGGRTWAEGEVGAGAAFHFSLPSTPPATP